MSTPAGVVSELREAGHDVGELLLAAMDSCLKTVEGVSDSAWSSIPIGVWSTRDVVNHVTYEALWATELFQGATILDVGERFEGDVVGNDPKQAFREAVAATRSVISAARSSRSHDKSLGRVHAGQRICDAAISGFSNSRLGHSHRLRPRHDTGR